MRQTNANILGIRYILGDGEVSRPRKAVPPATFKPANLRHRVAYIMVRDDASQNYRAGTFSSYNIHGNVDLLLQDYLKGIMQTTGSGSRWKLLSYKYDLISGIGNDERYNTGKTTWMKEVDVWDAFYYPLSPTTPIPQRQLLFGASDSKKVHNIAMFSISDYDAKNNLYVTIKLERDGRKTAMKVVWLPLD